MLCSRHVPNFSFAAVSLLRQECALVYSLLCFPFSLLSYPPAIAFDQGLTAFCAIVMSGWSFRPRMLCSREACKAINSSSRFCNSAPLYVFKKRKGASSTSGMPCLNMSWQTLGFPEVYRNIMLAQLRCCAVKVFVIATLVHGFFFAHPRSHL